MAYTPFEPDTPVIADDGDVVINNTRENLMALRDAVVTGALVGWAMAATGGTAEEPAQIQYTRTAPAEWLRLAITWGTSGGADGSPTSIVYSYSGISEADLVNNVIGTWGGTYDASGNLTAEAWT